MNLQLLIDTVKMLVADDKGLLAMDESNPSGVILYDETIHQSKKNGTPFLKVITAAGIISGIKVDTHRSPSQGG